MSKVVLLVTRRFGALIPRELAIVLCDDSRTNWGRSDSILAQEPFSAVLRYAVGYMRILLLARVKWTRVGLEEVEYVRNVVD